MSLSDEQVVEYIRGGGKVCPYCKSDDIEGRDRDYYGLADMYQEVSCRSCGESWQDHYKLVGIGAITAYDLPAEIISLCAFIQSEIEPLVGEYDTQLKERLMARIVSALKIDTPEYIEPASHVGE